MLWAAVVHCPATSGRAPIHDLDISGASDQQDKSRPNEREYARLHISMALEIRCCVGPADVPEGSFLTCSDMPPNLNHIWRLACTLAPSSISQLTAQTPPERHIGPSHHGAPIMPRSGRGLHAPPAIAMLLRRRSRGLGQSSGTSYR